MLWITHVAVRLVMIFLFMLVDLGRVSLKIKKLQLHI